ncbi:16S rRNA (adenine(1518)-N(6)/adenine(1519)-N(6))-dimethyltransferase RsmA [Pontibacter akesuensis]|uniref:Ribosomal RNA small subunit methyltransferase A n=1 Tax=Pontibacter akesuensis TaxID=388950 RepID=A0A1I7GJ22_9BACT|nr:16S rRNA (adenine(1518)-N(6)/adenine(1519)-N(6))-dimethyltransferase RsmA [Pontibacter akesuensis]GHA56520.1 ribosomal RNA small subunit methyltransferase A [Pontibacter akesuensis]SFU48457.1 dimethyladenosine transferase [Pontibacter akesuensis]
MGNVRPKKHLGQHFLVDQNIAAKIVEQLTLPQGVKDVLEIGPGMGVLTKYLLQHQEYSTTILDIDKESIVYLQEHFPELGERIVLADFLRTDLSTLFPGKFSIIGNFPYNISSQIFFKVLDHRDVVPEVVCMIQKEVAERLASPPGSKVYGILSVLLQAFYTIEYKFTVAEHVFNPPPKVKSAVIRLVRNEVEKLDCNEKLFRQVVKLSFGTRRKTLRNSLRSFNMPAEVTALPVFNERPEQLSVQEFVTLTQLVEQHQNT